MTDSLNKLPFDKLTHINLWFFNPDSLGNFNQDLSSLAPFIIAAHAKQVKVLLSIGGGSSHPYYHELLKDTKRTKFVSDLVSAATTHNIEGIDVDLEGSDIYEYYKSFVTELADALRMKNKMIRQL